MELQFGLSNIGNNTGNFGYVTNDGLQLDFAGGTNITLSQSLNAPGNNATISIIGPAASQMSVVQSLQGSTGQISFNAGNNISLSVSSNALTIIDVVSSGTTVIGNASTNSIGTQTSYFSPADHQHAPQQVSRSLNYLVGQSIGTAIGQSSVSILHFPVEAQLQLSRLNFYLSASSIQTTNTTASVNMSAFAQILTNNAASLSNVVSGSASWAQTWSQGIGINFVSGIRQISIPMATTLTAGDYFIAVGVQSATTASNITWVPIVGVTGNATNPINLIGVSNATKALDLIGVLNAQTAGTAVSFGVANITATGVSAIQGNLLIELAGSSLY
jgi:hypothetical protein